MKKVAKWVGIVLGSLIVLLLLLAVGFSIAGSAHLKKTLDIPAEDITIPTDEAALARGEHLVEILCSGCHAEDLSGEVLVDEPAIVTIHTANITGLAKTHTDADLVRAIRHAVDTDGRRLTIMPAEVFVNFSAEDLGAIISYLKSLPSVGKERPIPKLTFAGRILLASGAVGQIFSAEVVDHNQPFPNMPVVGANEEYGEYLSRFCAVCHGADLSGGQFPDPEFPAGPNLTQGGRLAIYSEESFIQTLRTGVTPYNTELDPEFMPWQELGKFDDEELAGIWLYLKSLPPRYPEGGE